jgi:hypothetical protein
MQLPRRHPIRRRPDARFALAARAIFRLVVE